MTNIVRFCHKETGTKTYKVCITLEDEDTQKRVLREGVHLGWEHHKCAEHQDRRPHGSAPGNTISQCFNCQKWNPDHKRAQCKEKRACLWCSQDHFHKECPHFQNKDKEHAKCANCNEAHPAWSKDCVAFKAASKNSSQPTMARVVSSNSMSKSDLDAAVGRIWESLAPVISMVVSRAVLDLEVELKKPRVSKSELVLKTTANAVKAIKDCGLLHTNGSLELTTVQQTVWKDIFPQSEFPAVSQGSSTPQNSMTSQISQ